jgi:type I restriction enzyme S subunit
MYGDGNTAGNVAINKVPLATNQACCNFTLNPKVADYRYVYHYLKGSYSNLVGLKLGGSQQNLNAATLKSFPIHLPSLATQQKIAAILSTYDDLIANNQRRITLLERMAEDIYREWFVRLRFPGHENVKVEKGVPQGWNAVRFSTLCKFEKGRNPAELFPAQVYGSLPYLKESLNKSTEHALEPLMCATGA